MNFVAIGSDDDLLPINEILGNKFQWNLNQYTTILIEKKNTFENIVCKYGQPVVN